MSSVYEHDPIRKIFEPSSKSVGKKRRLVIYGEPDYFKHLPTNLEHLNVFDGTGFPFADGSLGIWKLSYEMEVDDTE